MWGRGSRSRQTRLSCLQRGRARLACLQGRKEARTEGREGPGRDPSPQGDWPRGQAREKGQEDNPACQEAAGLGQGPLSLGQQSKAVLPPSQGSTVHRLLTRRAFMGGGGQHSASHTPSWASHLAYSKAGWEHPPKSSAESAALLGVGGGRLDLTGPTLGSQSLC